MLRLCSPHPIAFSLSRWCRSIENMKVEKYIIFENWNFLLLRGYSVSLSLWLIRSIMLPTIWDVRAGRWIDLKQKRRMSGRTQWSQEKAEHERVDRFRILIEKWRELISGRARPLSEVLSQFNLRSFPSTSSSKSQNISHCYLEWASLTLCVNQQNKEKRKRANWDTKLIATNSAREGREGNV